MDWAVRALKRRDGRRVAYLGAVALAAIAISNVLHDPASHNVSEEWAFTGSSLISEERLPQAESACRKALFLDPGSSFAWDVLGLARYDSGDLSGSRQAFSESVTLNPKNAEALYHLGVLDQRQRRYHAAEQQLSKAVSLSPFNVGAVHHLGEVLLALGEAGESLPYLRQAASQLPSDAQVHRELARALGISGHLKEARDQVRIVVELSPGDANSWVDLCLLSLDLHDLAGARAALARARELGAPPERLAFAARAMRQVEDR